MTCGKLDSGLGKRACARAAFQNTKIIPIHAVQYCTAYVCCQVFFRGGMFFMTTGKADEHASHRK